MIIDITKYSTPNNIAPGVTEAIKTAKEGDTILFPKNTYHFYQDYCQARQYHMTNTDSFDFPKKRFAMLFENKKGITVDGNGSTFVMHGNLCAFSAVECENIVFKNFCVTFKVPTNIEFVVKQNKGFEVTYQINNDYQWALNKNKITFYEESPFTKEKYWQFDNNGESFCAVVHDGKTVYRSAIQPFTGVRKINKIDRNTFSVKSWMKKKYPVGSAVTISENKKRSNAGMFFWKSKNIYSENITVNYIHGFGWLTQMCEDVSFKKIAFKPGNNHYVSSFADCIHVCGCKGKVTIDECYFSQPHDDGINIHGAFLRFNKKIDKKTAVFEFVHRQQGGYSAFYVGDKVKLYYRNNLQQCGQELTVKAVSDDIENKKCTVTFEEQLPVDIEAVFLGQKNIVAENITYCPDVEIMNCTFTAIPTRGILCTTSGKVDIHHNSFDTVQMANVFISNDACDWYESGPVCDMKIHNNKFIIGKTLQKEWKVVGAIFIDPITLGKKVTKPVHKNISIFDNDMQIEEGYALYSIGAQNVTIDDKINKVVIK